MSIYYLYTYIHDTRTHCVIYLKIAFTQLLNKRSISNALKYRFCFKCYCRDHASGNKMLIERDIDRKFTVIGADGFINSVTLLVPKPKLDYQFGSLNISCLRTRSHTTDHVCYHVYDDQESVVFTGNLCHTI